MTSSYPPITIGERADVITASVRPYPTIGEAQFDLSIGGRRFYSNIKREQAESLIERLREAFPEPEPVVPDSLTLLSSLGRPVEFDFDGPEDRRVLTITNHAVESEDYLRRPQKRQVRSFDEAQVIKLRDFLNANYPPEANS